MVEKQVALITVSSRGSGNAIAMSLAGAGATVVGTSTSAEGASALSMSLASHGYNGRGVVLDVGNAASIDALMQDLEAAGQMPTILVNNAAITRDTLLLRMKQDDWDQVIATNLTSVFRLSKACLKRMMRERHRQCGAGQLCRSQGGGPGFHQVARQGGCIARHHRERGGTRIHRYRHDT